MDHIRKELNAVYGASAGQQAWTRLRPLIEGQPAPPSASEEIFSERDAVLITYGDTLQTPGEAPLKSLYRFAAAHLKDIFSAIHILPFYPFSSDDGFSVIEYMQVNPELGTWDDVRNLGNDFELMFDLVLNHISAQSPWFQQYLQQREGFSDLAIATDPALDLSAVTRPRALPLLTQFQLDSGERVHLWTTFSADQIDLNFKSLDVLEKMVEVMCHYVRHGATLLRLDAVAYLWKEIGTTCIHLPQTHAVVRLLRAILDVVAPQVILITETNVPHAENISYFGEGTNEAQMVYNFTLPPLLFYTLISQDATYLNSWASQLQLPSSRTTYFNFTASHDGIGVRPLEGILPPAEIARLLTVVQRNQGQISYKQNPNGTQSPYELNITYLDALRRGPLAQDQLLAERFLASQAIQLALPGVPGVYIHSLLGSTNWIEGVQQTGRARSINRQKLPTAALSTALADVQSRRSRIFYPYCNMLQVRRSQPAFHPNAECQVLALNAPRLFGLKRQCQGQSLCAITNISDEALGVDLPERQLQFPAIDLLSGETFEDHRLGLAPYQTVWLSHSPDS